MERPEYEAALKELGLKLEPDAMTQERIDFTWDLHSSWLQKVPISSLNAVLAGFSKQAHYNTSAGGLESAIEALIKNPVQEPARQIIHDITCCDRGMVLKYKLSSLYTFKCPTHSMSTANFPIWQGHLEFLDFPHCEHRVDIKTKCVKCEHKNHQAPELTHGHIQNKGTTL